MNLSEQFESIYIKTRLLENKDKIIRNLKNLSDIQKDTLIDFFKKHPSLENKINCNDKDLYFRDFEDMLSTPSNSDIKRGNLGSLTEGKDYLNFGEVKNYTVYAPLNYNASRVIASVKVGGVEGKWCTAYQKTAVHWLEYTRDDIKFLYLLF